MGVDVKVCGLTDEVSAEAAVEGGARWLGVVFFPRSPRHVTAARAAEIFDGLPREAERVGLFVDPDDRTLDETLNAVRLDWIQLHGHESPERVEALRREYGLRVIKAIGVDKPADLEHARAYAETADRLLFDAKPPAGADRPGGNAAAFEWTVMKGYVSPLPWLLAGGLTAETLARAVAQSGARAVDVSSGVERRPGRKDPGLIRAFLAAARALP